jgi:D-hydroxyproline dehydrogenase subunit beta
MSGSFDADVLVVGAGIVGLAHAWAAARAGLKVTVVERDAQCVGASVRNFGFITVTGQRSGITWDRARRSRERWADLAQRAGIPVLHRGLWLLAQRPEARDVLEAFKHTAMGAACELHTARDMAKQASYLRADRACAGLYSPHELRVESRTALPRLAARLAQEHGVHFLFNESVLDLAAPLVRTSRRQLRADRVVVCTGDALTGVGAPALAEFGLQLTRLQMLRVAPEAGFRLGAAVMSDLSLVRYKGYADLPVAEALRQRLNREMPRELRHGVHLIAVQSADGSLVVGDSHRVDSAAHPFISAEIDALILNEMRQVLNMAQCRVLERWTGTYPTGPDQDAIVAAPNPSTRVVVVCSGTGASTAFALADDVFQSW